MSNELDAILHETGSPRIIFPYVKKSRKLKILPPEESSDSSQDEDSNADFENAQMKKYIESRNKRVYMISKFIKVNK